MFARRETIHTLAKVVLACGTACVLWWSRVFQVALFLIAAGLRRWSRANVTGPANRATDWEHVRSPAILSAPSLNALALLTYHPEYHDFDPRQAIISLGAARRLGVGWLRIDVRWHAVLPAGDVPDRRALAWYKELLSASSGYGFKNMVVLSSPPNAVLRQSSTKKLESWNRFVEIASDELGTWCSAYQLFNEPNNPVYSFFTFREMVPALIRGASIVHRANQLAEVAINISMDIWGWREDLDRLVQHSGSSIDIVGVDHYPGTWTAGRNDRWSEVIELAETIASASSGSAWFRRRLAIIETGFCTNTPLRDQRRQAEYFERVAIVLEELKHRLAPGVPLFGIYELCDGDSSAWLDPEAHFGLLTSQLQLKRAYSTVAHFLTSL